MNWTCTHCGRAQLAVGENLHRTSAQLFIGQTSHDKIGYEIEALRCLNLECNKPTIFANFGTVTAFPSGRIEDVSGNVFSDRIYPRSLAKPQPVYIPNQIQSDYFEACLIANLSPKASATLSRRCIQGIIRDFAQISGKTLYQEIETLKSSIEDGTADRSISEESVEALHAVRGIGNIGAHMEADVNNIIDVDPDEATVLIELIEQLFVDWYGERQKRQDRLARVKEVAAEKNQQKTPKSTPLKDPA